MTNSTNYYDFSDLKLSDADKITLLIKMMRFDARIRKSLLTRYKVPNRTKLQKVFQFNTFWKLVQQIKNTQNVSHEVAKTMAFSKLDREYTDSAIAILKNINIYDYMSNVFEKSPRFLINSITEVMGNYPNGLNIHLTNNFNGL